MVKLFKTYPAAILGAVQAIVALVVSFGVHLTADQTGSILAAAAAIAALIVHQNVTPVTTPPAMDPTPMAAVAPVVAASEPPVAPPAS